MTRRRLVVLVLAPTILVGLVLGAVFIVDARSQQQEVERAEAAATRYQDRLAAYRSAVVSDLDAVDATDPMTVSEVLDRHAEELPELQPVPERAAAASVEYETARRTQASVSDGLETVQRVIETSAPSTEFVAAARRALSVEPTSLAPSGAVASGDPLRNALLPPMRTALASFESVPVPQGAETASEAVSAALQHVIDEGEQLAAMLDAGRSGSFTWQAEYQAAAEAVQQYEDGVQADLREALDGVLASDVAA